MTRHRPGRESSFVVRNVRDVVRRFGWVFPAAVIATEAVLVVAALGDPAFWWLPALAGVLGVAFLTPTASFLSHLRNQLKAMSVSSLTDLAALLAGSRRPVLRAEWHAHLAGESGHDPVTWRKVRQALGFVVAAIQLRLADAAGLAWRPADAVLRSRTLSNLFVWGPVIVAAVAIVRREGRYGLVVGDQQLAELGGSLYLAIRVGRWWRNVKPPEPKARRARE